LSRSAVPFLLGWRSRALVPKFGAVFICGPGNFPRGKPAPPDGCGARDPHVTVGGPTVRAQLPWAFSGSVSVSISPGPVIVGQVAQLPSKILSPRWIVSKDGPLRLLVGGEELFGGTGRNRSPLHIEIVWHCRQNKSQRLLPGVIGFADNLLWHFH